MRTRGRYRLKCPYPKTDIGNKKFFYAGVQQITTKSKFQELASLLSLCKLYFLFGHVL